jgi:cytochrome c-type biogenesis protein CcmF
MSDLGSFALRLALLVATTGMVAGVLAGLKQRSDWAEVARRSVLTVFALLCVSMLTLFWAFYAHDYSLLYVANHSARSMELGYRLAALWGGQAGSLMLWCWMLTAYGAAAVIVNRRQTTLLPWVSASLLANTVFFLVLLNLDLINQLVPGAVDVHTHPFERLPAGSTMSDGAGLNPLLQHPVMMIHPLMLYTGLTGFAVPFAFGFAALASGELGTAWMRITRRWTLWAWFFLSIGILLGGRWAYEVLGWGGYWAWDPVENSSLMPWLAATAYLHSVMVQEKRDMLKIWNLVLIGLTYSLCLFGTMLTRSGLVRSVHAFAQTEIFGQLFLGYVVLTVVIYFGVLFLRRSQLRATNEIESVLSRESGFVVNNWLFMALLGIVITGTLWPKITDWLMGVEQSMGPQFFNMLGAPIGIFLLFLTGVGPLIAWRRATSANLRRQFKWPAISGVVAFAVLAFATRERFEALAVLTWATGVFVVATITQEYWRAIGARMRHGENVLEALGTLMRKNQRRYGGYVVHLGMVFLFVGFAGAAFNEEHLENVSIGGNIELNGYRLEYRTARPIPAQHYGGAEARIALFDHGRPVATMRPERRMYWLEEQPVSIPSVYSTFREDLYVVLTAVEADGSATLKIYRNPLVNWIWAGGFTFVIGTILVMWPHPAVRNREEKAA